MVKYDYAIFFPINPDVGVNILEILCRVNWQWYWWRPNYLQFRNFCSLDILSISYFMYLIIISKHVSSLIGIIFVCGNTSDILYQ